MPSTMNYSFKVVSPAVAFGNAYSSGAYVFINCNSGPNGSQQQSTKNFIGNLQTLRIQGTANYPSLQASQFAGIEIKGYRDAAGTELILEPTAGIIYADVTGGKYSIVFSLDLIINLAPSDVLYLFIKTVHVKPDGTAHAAGALDTFTVNELEVVNRRF